MARELRVEVPGGWYHEGSRGNYGQRIFFRPLDYAVFLDRAARIARRCGWIVVVYCPYRAFVRDGFDVPLREPR